MKNEKIWYELDAFAKTYSSIISEGRTTCFRLSALFSENIDLEILKKVAISLEKKYPFYNSELKKGIFWNYLQQKKAHFMIEEEKTYPCTDIQKDNPLRIIYFNNKLSIEIAHFLTDGKGAALFFQDLIEEYLEKKYFLENIEKDEMDSLTNEVEKKKEVKIEKIKKIINFGKKINKNGKEKDFENKKIEKNFFEKTKEILGNDSGLKNAQKNEYVDLYEKYMRKVSKETTIKSAFHLPMKILEKGQYHITTGEINIKSLKEESKKYGTTIGKYLLSVYFKVLLDRYSQAKNPIVIGVPVDLRKIFEETTYRNFFINITPSVDASLGAYSLSEIITYLDNYFALKITKKEFYKSIYKAMNPIQNIIIKSVPYLIKRIFFPFIFDYYGERGYTTGFSNLGIFKVNKKYEKYLKGFRFLPPPSKRCKIKMGVISDYNKVYVNFGNLTANYDIERDFFIYLRKRGIKSKIITNYF
ncbi:alcohol acetyltransferase [Leptotrichia sp. oral taxon 223]|uniref:alcohol acetyltransferase n=1 Tax=Leptotrichia sp. oral taxon 223 TaxID=712363 RepID=UPI0015B9FA3D|nr:alcohol acetyltransferase [Leptotrichia sp. oral taxon 223]